MKSWAELHDIQMKMDQREKSGKFFPFAFSSSFFPFFKFGGIKWRVQEVSAGVIDVRKNKGTFYNTDSALIAFIDRLKSLMGLF